MFDFFFFFALHEYLLISSVFLLDLALCAAIFFPVNTSCFVILVIFYWVDIVELIVSFNSYNNLLLLIHVLCFVIDVSERSSEAELTHCPEKVSISLQPNTSTNCLVQSTTNIHQGCFKIFDVQGSTNSAYIIEELQRLNMVIALKTGLYPKKNKHLCINYLY